MTRRLTEKNACMHDGVWDKAADGSHEIRGRRLGIVGYGNIGTQLSVLAENLGMHVSFYDTADKLALGNAAPLRQPRGAAGDLRRGHAARRRPARQRRLLRRRAVRADAPGQPLPQPVPRHRGRPRRRCATRWSAGTSPARRSTSSRTSRRAAATSSSPSCAACRTSSSPRTSAGRPRRRSPTSATSWPTSWPTSSQDGNTTLSVNLPSVALPAAARHEPDRARAPQHARACWPRSTASWPSTTSTSRASC